MPWIALQDCSYFCAVEYLTVTIINLYRGLKTDNNVFFTNRSLLTSADLLIESYSINGISFFRIDVVFKVTYQIQHKFTNHDYKLNYISNVNSESKLDCSSIPSFCSDLKKKVSNFLISGLQINHSKSRVRHSEIYTAIHFSINSINRETTFI